jgi:hypothetical protein
MVAECAKLSVDDRTCDNCRHLAKQDDCFPVITGELGSEPIIAFHHCICYNCGHEWVL